MSRSTRTAVRVLYLRNNDAPQWTRRAGCTSAAPYMIRGGGSRFILKGRGEMKFTRKGVTHALAIVLAAHAGPALAGGFQIGVQSGSATGNAVSGGAAVAEDASVVWSNPAGMMHLKQPRQLSTALHILKPSFKFQNGGST